MAKAKKKVNAEIIATLGHSVNFVIHADGETSTIYSTLPFPFVFNFFYAGTEGEPQHNLAVMVPANGEVTFDLDGFVVGDDATSRAHGID